MRQSANPFVLLFALTLFILASSCQKDPVADIIPEASCKLTKAYFFDETTGKADSLVYSYDNNKITRAENTDGYITLQYTTDKITKRNFYEAGSQQPGAYDVFTYNNDGTISSIKTYFQFDSQTIPAEQYDFSYAGNKLLKLDLKYYNTTTSQYELEESTAYVYTGDNITQSITTTPGTTLADTLNYAYDTDKNYFSRSNALFLDLTFMDGIGGSIIPLFISSNNVINVYEDGDEFPLSYKTDDNGNFSEWYLDGELASRYIYDCN